MEDDPAPEGKSTINVLPSLSLPHFILFFLPLGKV